MNSTGKVFKTSAIILRRSDLGEADRLLTLYTPEFGKVRAVAKGVRKPTARAAGHVELYTLVDLVVAQGRELHIITQADLIEPYLNIQKDLLRIGYASLFAELIDRFAMDDLVNKMAFDLLARGLGWLCEDDIDLKLAARYYEMHLLDVMGYAPSLYQCAMGGEPLEAQDQFYSVVDGGVVCPEHAAGYPNLTPLPLPVFKIMRHFMRTSWDNVKPLKLNPHQHHLLQVLLHNSLIYLLEKRLQSVDFLRKISARMDEAITPES
jgi:DNA repair protein RecO (recombination protein O)